MTDITEEIEEIAIVGMAGRFPGAENLDQFWQNLRNGRDGITHFSDEELLARGVTPEELAHPDYVKSGCVLEGIDQFAAGFFGYSAKQAESMDPQQRIFLELAWEALEDAGCDPETFIGSIGVFGGSGGNDYRKSFAADFKSVASDIESFQVMINNDADYLATRVAYKLNLTGPCLTLQTACSTSLVALHLACQHILNYQCDMALAGGVSIRLPQGLGYRYQEGMIWSSDGVCRSFAEGSRGTILGRGAGIVCLKRLSDALADGDVIHAVIKSSAVNNDGSDKVGFTAPSVEGQAEVIALAQNLAGVLPDSITYIETHGTGTPLGDPIEIQALTQAFREGTDRCTFCPIGSVKSNIGHLDAAAGIAGLIKTVLALKHKEIPPSLHCSEPNRAIDWGQTPFFVNTELTPWPAGDGPRRAGVSSFGIGGTNAHVILEEAPKVADVRAAGPYLLLLSAKSAQELKHVSTHLGRYLEQNPAVNMASVARSLREGRKHFDFRTSVVCCTPEMALPLLGNVESPHPVQDNSLELDGVVFMFSGQGSQFVDMAKGLFESEPVFREQLQYCFDFLQPLMAVNLFDLFFPRPEFLEEAKCLISETSNTQPALFVVEYSLAKLLASWGIEPSAMVGHSIGEYVAACLAGVFSLDDALRIVVQRGRLMQDLAPGLMLSVPLAEDALRPLLPPSLAVAVVNSPEMIVVSGEADLINRFKTVLLDEHDLDCRILKTSHAFHSHMMEPMLATFKDIVSAFSLNRPQVPFTSNVSGTWITSDDAVSPEYWANHLRCTVRFADCLQTLFDDGKRVFVEVGPGQVLTNLGKWHPHNDGCSFIPTMRRPVARQDDQETFFSCLGMLWSRGQVLAWPENHENVPASKVSLPTYPFSRERYWHGGATLYSAPVPERFFGSQCAGDQERSKGRCSQSQDPASRDAVFHPRPDLVNSYQEPVSGSEKIIANIWQEELGLAPIGVDDNFFELGGDSLLATRVMARINDEAGFRIPLDVLATGQTVKALAESFLDDEGGGATWQSLVLLRDGVDKNRPKLFIPHGVNGNVHWGNVYIIKHIDREQPIYGFSVPKGVVFKTLTEMAHFYVKEMKLLQPEGPYCLAGYCYGGALAYEIAYQLTLLGDEVAFLGLIEAWPTNTDYGKIDWSLNYVAKFLQNLPFVAIDFAKMPVKSMRFSIVNKIKRAARIVKDKFDPAGSTRKINHFLLDEMFDVNELKDPERLAIMENNLKLQRESVPQPCHVKAYVFRARRQAPFSPHDPEMGWAALALDGVSSQIIPGSHRLAIQEPYSQELSRLLCLSLNEALSQHRGSA